MQTLDLFLVQYGLLALFVLLFVKSIGVPVPIPADLLILGAAARAAQGKLVVWQVCVVVLLAVILGSLIQFVLASGPGRSVLYRFGRYIGLTPARLDAASKRIKQGSIIGVTTGMLIPGVRGVVIVASGLVGVPLGVFLPGLIIGSGLFFTLHFLLGYLGVSLFVIVGHVLPLSLTIGLVVVLLLVTLALWYVAFRRQKMARHELADASLEVWHEGVCPACLTLYTVGQLVTLPIDR